MRPVSSECQLFDCLSDTQDASLESQMPPGQADKTNQCGGLLHGTKDTCTSEGGSCHHYHHFPPKGSCKPRLNMHVHTRENYF